MILARAPLRISLGGGGTDLPSYYSRFGGFLLSASIDKYVYICLNQPAADDLIRLKYSRYEEVTDLADIEHDLARPALDLLDVRTGVEISSMADVPAGTGLGSSSTYLVCLLTALYELKQVHPPRHDLAETSCHIEMEIAGHPVGKQDHFTAAFGGIHAFDIDESGTVHVRPVALSRTTCEELRNGLLLFFTGVSRSANTILGAQREGTARDDADVLESLHATKELGRRAQRYLESGDLDSFGRLMDEHWQTKKRRSTAISDARIDAWYTRGLESGALGGKLVGAGGGGFLLFYCPAERRGTLREAMSECGLREMPFDFDQQGAKVLINI